MATKTRDDLLAESQAADAGPQDAGIAGAPEGDGPEQNGEDNGGGDGGGSGQPTGRQKWRDRGQRWKERGQKVKEKGKEWKDNLKEKYQDRKKRKALKKGKKAIKKLGQEARKRGQQVAQEAGKQAATKGAAYAGEAAVAGGGGAATGGVLTAAVAAYEAGKYAIKKAWQAGKRIWNGQYFSDPTKTKEGKVIFAIVGVFLFILIVILVVLFGGGAGWASESQQNDANNYVIITKSSNPATVANGQQFTYTISVQALAGAGVVTITDQLPTGVNFVSATGGATERNRLVTWSSLTNNLTAPFTTSFTITVSPSVSDAYIVNFARGSIAGIDVSGDAESLARQILANSNINLSSSARQDVEAVRDHKPINNSSSCGNTLPDPAVHPALLKVILQLGQRHTFDVWNIITNHGCDRFYHPKGRAMDIGNADGQGSWQNASFRQDAADVLPDGGTLLQTYCPGTPPVTTNKVLHQGADGCNHQHIDVGIDIP